MGSFWEALVQINFLKNGFGASETLRANATLALWGCSGTAWQTWGYLGVRRNTARERYFSTMGLLGHLLEALGLPWAPSGRTWGRPIF